MYENVCVQNVLNVLNVCMEYSGFIVCAEYAVSCNTCLCGVQSEFNVVFA